jgi:hypothetical protein
LRTFQFVVELSLGIVRGSIADDHVAAICQPTAGMDEKEFLLHTDRAGAVSSRLRV